jgi:orotate phosphoribosyltransferase
VFRNREEKLRTVNFSPRLAAIRPGKVVKHLTHGGQAMTDTERQLFNLIRERCYKEGKDGEFTLASGKKSNFYFDGKMIQMFSGAAALIGEVIYQHTKDMAIHAIGGLEIGAVPLTTAAVYTYGQHGREMEGFFVRQEAKKHGAKKMVEGNLKSGWKVAIVDDVVTEGKSVLKAVEAARRITEREPALILALVDRQVGAEQLFKEQGIPFKSVFTLQDFIKPK